MLYFELLPRELVGLLLDLVKPYVVIYRDIPGLDRVIDGSLVAYSERNIFASTVIDGYLELFKYCVLSRYFPGAIEQAYFYITGKHGTREMADYLHKELELEVPINFCILASSMGNVELVKWIVENGIYRRDDWFLYDVVNNLDTPEDILDIVQWLRNHGVPLTEYIYNMLIIMNKTRELFTRHNVIPDSD